MVDGEMGNGTMKYRKEAMRVRGLPHRKAVDLCL